MTRRRLLQIWTGLERKWCGQIIRSMHRDGIHGITTPELRRYRRTTRAELVRMIEAGLRPSSRQPGEALLYTPPDGFEIVSLPERDNEEEAVDETH